MTVVVLPWLAIDEQRTFGSYTIAPLEHVADQCDPKVAQTLRDIGSTFVAPEGPNDATVLWPNIEGTVPQFSAPDLDEVNLAVRSLAVGALVSNAFFTHSTPATTLNFDLIAQRFEPGAEFFSIETRRRDGSTLSGGHRFDSTRFTRPVAAPSRPQLIFNDPLLIALADCLDRDDPVSDRIGQSAVPFLLANRLDGSSSFQSDLFWLATALEQLLGVSERPKSMGITSAFTTYITDRLSPSGAGARIMLIAWARELYGRRSDVHGRPHHDQRWDTGWHAFLAGHAYGVVIKQMLAEAELYELTPSDEIDRAAFPHRVGRMRSRRLVEAASVWTATRNTAHWRRIRREVAEKLRLIADAETGDEAPP